MYSIDILATILDNIHPVSTFLVTNDTKVKTEEQAMILRQICYMTNSVLQ